MRTIVCLPQQWEIGTPLADTGSYFVRGSWARSFHDVLEVLITARPVVDNRVSLGILSSALRELGALLGCGIFLDASSFVTFG